MRRENVSFLMPHLVPERREFFEVFVVARDGGHARSLTASRRIQGLCDCGKTTRLGLHDLL
jgi:hypothetical protein